MTEPSGWELNWLQLRQPEYIHMLLHPIPIYGMILGLLAMVLALVLKSRPAQIVGLAVILFSAAMVGPVMHFGEEAYDRVLTIADDPGKAWLKEHEERAETFAKGFYVLAVLAAAAIFAPIKWPKTAMPLFVIVLLGSVVCFACGAWIGKAGGKIRHTEFRYEKPPVKTDFRRGDDE